VSGKLMSALFALKLTESQLLVALALADHGSDDGQSIFPSVAYIAWKVDKSDRQVQRIIRQLEQIGLLVKVADAHRYKPARYRMNTSAAVSKPARQGGHSYVTPDSLRGDIAMSIQGRHSYVRQGRHPDVTLTVKEPLLKPSLGETSLHAEALPLPPEAEARSTTAPETEARPKAALDVQEQIADVFEDWRIKARRSTRVQLTDARAKAVGGRIVRDRFTVDQLKLANDGVAAAIQAGELDYEHWWTEFYRVFMDREHVQAWIEYGLTGDYYVLSELFLTEQSKAS
jgi:hypothetical protein